MRPLVYLFTRSFFNGVKRSLTSPKRALSLIFFGLYYYFLIIRSVVISAPNPIQLPPAAKFDLPDPSIMGGVVFGVFSMASLFLMLGVLSHRGGFKAADVDVLFPTPISPRTVLIFRMARDYVFTLLAPLILGILGWRGTSVGVSTLFRNYPAHSMDLIRAMWLAWMLMALGWVSLGYGASLFVGRSDLTSDRNQKIINWSLNLLVLSALLYIGFFLQRDPSWATALRLSHSIWLQLVFLPATLATNLMVGSLQGNFLLISIAMGGLVAIIGLGLAVAMTQVGWLYDQAAAKGFASTSMRNMRKSGDHYALAAERARQGKTGRLMLSRKISRYTTRGSLAMVWKDLLLQLRGPMAGVLVTLTVTLATYGIIGWTLMDKGPDVLRAVTIGLPCMTAYLLATINGFVGFLEMLRRVDLLKPLPFSARRIVFFEGLSKLPISVAIMIVGTVLLCAMRPSNLAASISGLILGLSLLMVITGAILLAVVLFPDYDDPTQRGLSGIVMMLAVVICSSPGVALFLILSVLLKWPDLLAAVPAAAVALAISTGLSTVSGMIYADYNPNE